MPSHRTFSGRPLPWLVLYCGANPKVEEVSWRATIRCSSNGALFFVILSVIAYIVYCTDEPEEGRTGDAGTR